MSTYKIKTASPSANQFISLLPQEVEIDLDGQEKEYDFGCLGHQLVYLYDVEVNLRVEVENFFSAMDYTLDDVEVEVSVSDLLNACQDKTGWSNTHVAREIILEVMEWLDTRSTVERQRLIKKNNEIEVQNANLRALLKAAALAD